MALDDGPDDRQAPLHEVFSSESLKWLGHGVLISGAVLLGVAPSTGAPWEMLALLLTVVLAGGIAAVSASRGATRTAAVTFASTFLVSAILSMFLFGGVQTSSSVPLVSGVALCGVLLGKRGLVVAGVLASFSAVVVAWGTSSGWLVAALQPDTVGLAAVTVIGSIVVVCLVFLVGHRALDVTSERGAAARRRLAQRDEVDPVSSSLTLRALRRELNAMLADPGRRQDAALLIIRLDHGALIRRGFGASTRDTVIREVAKRLRLATRPDDLVGRSGDEEFAILTSGLGDPARAVAVAQRIAEQIGGSVRVEGKTLGLPLRLGVALVSAGCETADGLLRDGHAAVAAAGNRNGTNVGVFDAGLVRRAQRALELDEELARAIAGGELVAWYQPIVSLVDGRLEGFEALVRWEKAGAPAVPPGEFLPRAEATGAIVEIDRLVLKQACSQIAEWDRSHPDSKPWISVNLSAAQFETPDLVQAVADAIRDADIAPERLHLELTESALTVDVERTRELLTELKELGVVLALDDFGTGWSSLRYIQSYPIDVVKIDRSFIKTIDETGGHELAATVVFMAKELRLELVAEGIETRTQYRVLRDLGVQEGQGYHFSRPVPAARAAAFLAPWVPEEPSKAWDLAALKLVIGR